jgi:hypothetical protein
MASLLSKREKPSMGRGHICLCAHASWEAVVVFWIEMDAIIWEAEDSEHVEKPRDKEQEGLSVLFRFLSPCHELLPTGGGARTDEYFLASSSFPC